MEDLLQWNSCSTLLFKLLVMKLSYLEDVLLRAPAAGGVGDVGDRTISLHSQNLQRNLHQPTG